MLARSYSGFARTFRRPIHDFLSTLDRFTVNAGALKLEASTKKYEATALLGIATAQKADVGEMDPTKAVNIAKTIGGFSDQQILRLSGKRILWVDDNPENNAYEQRAIKRVTRVNSDAIVVRNF